MSLLELIDDLKSSIRSSVESCQLFLDVKFEIPEIMLEFPELRIHGELSTNVALVLSKKFSMSPVKLAGVMLRHFSKPRFVERIDVAQPGFINFFLGQNFFKKILLEIDKEINNYGKLSPKNRKVLVEFVSSNPTGPMHVGNARLGALGDSLAETLKFAGYDVSREFYVNDAGNQIKKFAESLVARYLQIFDPSKEFPEDGYHGDDIKELARQFVEIYGKRFLRLPNSEIEKAMLDYALPLNVKKIKLTLMSYKVKYDNWFHESSLYESGEIDSTLKYLKDKGVTYVRDEALWFKATEYGADKDEVLVRNNGIPTYFAADIAYHVNKFLIRKFDLCVDFLGADHHGHIPRMRAAMKCFGIDESRLIFVIVQLVRVIKDGEVVKISKRSGSYESLEDFIDLVGVDCSRFLFNIQDANSSMDFDIDLAVKNNINNPSYYVKYAYARIQSILKQFDIIPDKNSLSFDILDSELERELIYKLAMFPCIVKEVSVSMDVTKVAKYVMDLASDFHKFYNSNKVKCANLMLSNARYFLCLQISRVIENSLRILKMELPTQM